MGIPSIAQREESGFLEWIPLSGARAAIAKPLNAWMNWLAIR
jgi:hypothetical protein